MTCELTTFGVSLSQDYLHILKIDLDVGMNICTL